MPGHPQNGRTAHKEAWKWTPRPVPTNQKPNRQLSNESLIGRTHTQCSLPPPIQTWQPLQNNANTSEPRWSAS